MFNVCVYVFNPWPFFIRRSWIVHEANRKFALFSFPVCLSAREPKRAAPEDLTFIGWALRCIHGTTDHSAVTTNAEQMFISCRKKKKRDELFLHGGWFHWGGALAALRRRCSLFARCGTKSQDNKVNGHDPNSMPGSTAGEIGETNSKAVCIYVCVCVCVRGRISIGLLFLNVSVIWPESVTATDSPPASREVLMWPTKRLRGIEAAAWSSCD